jgi:preprotein translocase subunit SecD
MKPYVKLIFILFAIVWALTNIFEFRDINAAAKAREAETAQLLESLDKREADGKVDSDLKAKLTEAIKNRKPTAKKEEKALFKIGNYEAYSKLQLGLDLVGGSQFEFIAEPTTDVPEITPDIMAGLVKVFENRVNASGTTEALVQQVGKQRILVEVPGANPETVKRRLLATAFLEFKKRGPDGTWVKTGITGADFQKAQAASEGGYSWVVSFDLKPEAAKKFGDLTSGMIGQPLAIFLDGNLISAPNVQSAITGGSGQISGGFSVEEAQDLAVQLNAGALPVPVKILTERSISANLGQESISKSIKAGLIGFAGVILFMILVYRFSGIIASLALCIYILLALAVYRDAVTLTLAGVAGFVLSIGMAVDANILIFERAKEEMKNGKPVYLGLKDGFDKAYSSIFDSNMNTSMVCLILIIFGTGIVKGFAVTLLIGVILSLISSLFITKTLLFTVVDTFKIRETKFFK